MDKKCIIHLVIAVLVGILIGGFGLVGIKWTIHKFSGSTSPEASTSAAGTTSSEKPTETSSAPTSSSNP